jgi:hypothetical protein
LPSIEEREVFPVVCRADVAAPVGSGRDAALTGTVWSEAILTGIELAIVAAPKAAGIPASIEARLAISVAWLAAVAAPVGRALDNTST